MEGRVPVIKFVFFGRQELAALGQLKKKIEDWIEGLLYGKRNSYVSNIT